MMADGQVRTENRPNWLRSWTQGINPLLALGALALAGYSLFFASGYSLRILTLGGVFAILVLGYQFIFGHAGALSLAQGALFGLGAYATGILGSQWGWGFALTFPISIALPVVVAALIAAPVLRLETHYFALATLGIAQIGYIVAVNWESVTGGSNGLTGVPGIVLFGEAVPRGLPLFLAVWGATALFAFASWYLMRGIYGRAFQVMRTDNAVAAAIGLNTGRLRFTAFLLSAAYAGAAGALYVHVVRVVSPDTFEFSVMLSCMTMAVIGGRYRVSGAILGPLVLIHLPEWFRSLDRYNLIAYGTVLLIMIIMAPSGLIGTLEKLGERLRPEPRQPPPRSEPLAQSPKPSDACRPLLEVANVTKNFGGVRAVADVSFTIGRGEVIGLIGPNGSGKTTLINLISGFYRPDTGRIMLEDMDLIGRSPFEPARLGVARTFQNINLIEDMSAVDNVAVARAAKLGLTNLGSAVLHSRVGAERARAQAMSLLEHLGIGDVATALCGSLAYGTKRKVEIARALALEPKLLLLDEPAAGLNPGEQADLSMRLQSLTVDGLTVLVVEHNMPFLLSVAQRMICLDHGQLLADGAPKEVCNDPRVVEAYLGVTAA